MDNYKRNQLFKIIANEVFIKNSQEQIDFESDPEAWIFDFRRILMRGSHANIISELFYETYFSMYPFQIGTLEIGGVPLATSLMNTFYHKGHLDINAFFIRKSRKKTGLMRMIEGRVVPKLNIILVDDIMNSGGSFWRQIEVLESHGHKVEAVWSILRFRDEDYYKRFHERSIKVHSLFTLDDFTKTLGGKVKNLTDIISPKPMPFIQEWIFRAPNPTLNHVICKSEPVLDTDTIYVGSDSEYFYAINQLNGRVKWKFKVGKKTNGKSIYSNPILYNGLVIFGSYDGNVYALDKKTGKKVWVSFEADFVGSSPAAASDLGLIFIGLEYGLIFRRGGIAALDAKTGKTIWVDDNHPAFTHSSPKYISAYQQVVIGSNDGVVRLYEARSGNKLWEFTTFGGTKYKKEEGCGFGQGEIKESFEYDPVRDYIIFGATDGFLYILDRETGHMVKQFACDFAIWSTPHLYKDKVYFTSLDKCVRCIDLDTLEIIFVKNLDGSRIFGGPTVINNFLYVGTNAGRLHELNPDTGDVTGYFHTVERITNMLHYNPNSKTFFLPTYANEIIALKKRF